MKKALQTVITTLTLGAALPALAQDQGAFAFIGGDSSDPFFGAIKRGVDDAAAAFGVEVNYIAADITGASLAQAMEAAVATNPAGLAFGDWFPDAQDPIARQLSDAGTPVIGYNAAPQNWADSTGALAWVRQSDYEAGRIAGQQLAAAGVKHALCVNHAPGATLFEDRCDGLAKGMEEAGGTASDLAIPYEDASNPAKVMTAIQGQVMSDGTIDGLFTLGSGVARNALQALADQPPAHPVVIGTVDLSTDVLHSVADGDLLFAIDQQPYLQGFYAIAGLAQAQKYGLHPVGEVATGPLVITGDSADRAIQINAQERGIRGAL